ncbi:MAG: cell wall-binding repeat-containing protein [Oscillospiraceae bacterium]|jgi:putative cell wall-binding protein|nr:cell wall-binding repeat-containing protein [Oscillospiraceae bacterium]
MKKIFFYLTSFIFIASICYFANFAAFAAGEAANWYAEAALAEAGYKEGSGNNTKYGKWIGNNGTGWCAAFAAWSANRADEINGSVILNKAVPKAVSARAAMDWYKGKSLYKDRGSYTPKRGDQIYFDWNPGTGIDHVAIVTGVSTESGKTYVNTIEGNTSDSVKARKYLLTDKTILGYGIFDDTKVDYSKCKTFKPIEPTRPTKPEEPIVLPKLNVDVHRISGGNRVDTAIEISKAQSEGGSSETVMLTTALSYKDALAAAPLAAAYDAPVLLTKGGAELESSVKEQIKALKAKNVIIASGTAAIPVSIEEELSKTTEVTRLAGRSSIDTAIQLGTELYAIEQSAENTEEIEDLEEIEDAENTEDTESSKEEVITAPEKSKTAALVTVNGFADALSFAPVAAIEGIPVLYTNGKQVSAETLEFLEENNVEKVIVIGGTSSVSAAEEEQIQAKRIATERIAGSNRYTTGVAIYNKYRSLFGDEVTLATGLNFPDALAGSGFAAKNGMPIFLVAADSVNSEVKAAISANTKTKHLYLLGGASSISDMVPYRIYMK